MPNKKPSCFYSDFSNGRRNELRLCKILQYSGNTEVTMVSRYDKKNRELYDLTYINPKGERGFIEVKTDDKYATTGNVAIEVRTGGNWTGLFKTGASFWVQKLKDKFYCIDTFTLRNYIAENWNNLKHTWHSGVELVLIPGEVFFSLNPFLLEDRWGIESIPDEVLDNELQEFDNQCFELLMN